MPMAMTSVINGLKYLSISSGQDKDIAFIISYQYAAKHGFEKRAKILALNFFLSIFLCFKIEVRVFKYSKAPLSMFCCKVNVIVFEAIKKFQLITKSFF